MSVLVLAPFIIWPPTDAKVDPRPIYLLIALGLCIVAIASRFVYVLACLVMIAPAVLHQHLTRHWGRDQLDARFEAILESPPGEMREYLQSHVDAFDILFMIAAIVYAVFLIRWTVQSCNAPGTLRKAAVVAILAGVVVFAGLGLDRYLVHFLPYEMFAQAASAKQRYRQLSLRTHCLEVHRLPARDCGLKYDKIVIVLGESATSDHMSIFGYLVKTTPFAERSGAYAFDALSPSNQTRFSLGMMLTSAKPGAFDSFYRSHSLVGELRQCGLDTLWISNQGRRGEHDSFVTSMALEADEQVFLNECSWRDSQFDGKVVDELAARGAYGKRGRATIIHLIGSHTDYAERVPVDFGHPDASSVVTSYDNTILYTDHILSELYRHFADESLLFVYVSDHGQMVSDDRYGSGFLPGHKEEYRTPMLVWTKGGRAIAALRDAIGDARLNLESFDDVVRYLVGITPKPEISTSQSVSVLTPDDVIEYGKLESLPGERLPALGSAHRPASIE